MSEYRAIVIGATGAVGSALVRELLASPRAAAVTIVVRRQTDAFTQAIGSAKLVQRVVEMAALDQEPDSARGMDVAFCTMGIGQPRKVSKDELWKVDVAYASTFGRLCRAAGVRHMSILTAVGANARSRSFYMRVKGSAEDAMRGLGFPRTSFFRPSLLVTQDIRYGLQDRVTQAVFPGMSWMLPRRWHQIRVEDLARAMRINAERPAASAVEILHYPEFAALLAA